MTPSGTPNGQTITVTGATVLNSPYTLTLVTSYFSGITSTESCTASLTVNETAKPNVAYTAPACDQNTFSITISGVLMGAVYTVKDKDGGTITNILPASPFTALNSDNLVFSNIPAGSGYQVTASVNSCESSANSCPLITNKIAKKTEKVVAPIEVISDNVSFTAFPVPFKENITIRYNFDYKTNARIEIYDLRGRLLMTHDDPDAYFDKEVTLNTKFNNSDMQLLFIKVTTNKGAATKKVIAAK